ncbi:energy transducer TonB [Gemmatimonas sp.]|uniref:energy transducer TonB n=1 Tax=Gemmatimonas sp. TaxID=1962908 RepID=UPI00286D7EEC|nr:energy transducer TonB [Gemmatimonas sp.]
MFQTLIESRATRTRSVGGSMVSVVVHAGIVGALVVATAQATVAHVAEERETSVKFTNTTPPPPPPPAATREVFTATPVAKGFTVLQTPIDIPTSLPPIDLSAPPTNLDNFTGIGKPGGRADGVEGATGAARALNDVFLESEVERPVAVLPGTAGPVYPETLRAAGIEGQVLAQFVVDSAGRVELATFKVLDSQHPLFVAAVRRAVSRIRYLPAEARGARVAQLVQQSFHFTVRRD